MDIIRSFSRRAFSRIFFYLVFLGALIFLALYFGLDVIKTAYPELTVPADQLLLMKKHLMCYVLPVLAGVFLLTAFALWVGVRGSAKRLMASSPIPGGKESATRKEVPAESKAQRRRQDKQMFLYLLSLLQREGRLMDFLAEDLAHFEDAQIGAAVRGIHENCKKVVEKNLSPKPVIEKPEGETITVDPGFDPAAIKLVGNVSGEPPFTGVLRHRGWQSKKEEMPTLSGTQDPGILAPAEVEIQ